MELEYWESQISHSVVIAHVYDDGTVQVGNNHWCDYVSFSAEMERYGYKRI